MRLRSRLTRRGCGFTLLSLILALFMFLKDWNLLRGASDTMGDWSRKAVSVVANATQFEAHNDIIVQDALLMGINITNSSSATSSSSTEPAAGVAFAVCPPGSVPPIEQGRLWTVDVIFRLAGELGNHMGFASKPYAYKWRMWNEHKVDVRIHFKGQGIGKSFKTEKELHACFPQFRNVSTHEVNTDLGWLWELQEEWLQDHWPDVQKEQMSVTDDDYASFERAVEEVLLLSCYHNSTPGIKSINATMNATDQNTKTKDTNGDADREDILSRLGIRLPFVQFTENGMAQLEELQFQRAKIRDLFALDESKCCGVWPAHDETVLHIRGFITEMPRVGKNLGFQELDPERTATDLLGHLEMGEKVAIISRFPDMVEDYVSALERRGLVVRVVKGQSGVKDFCLMRNATRIAGFSRSWYFKFASFMSDASRVDVYYINSNNKTWKFDVPLLRERYHHHVFEFDA